jgi:hypothetical protein
MIVSDNGTEFTSNAPVVHTAPKVSTVNALTVVG